MYISKQTTLTTCLSIGAGVATAYYSPSSWITGVFVGTFMGYMSGSSDLESAMKSSAFFRDTAIKNLNGSSLPGVTTMAFNGLACYLAISKIALPRLLWAPFIGWYLPLNTIVLGLAGGMVSYTLMRYGYLNQLNTWANNLKDPTDKTAMLRRLSDIVV